MQKKLYWIFSLLIVVSMILSACATESATEAPAVEQPVAEEAPAEEPVEEPVEEPAEEPEVEVFDPAIIDQNFATMLSTMAGYNTIQAAGLMEELASDSPPFLLDVRTTAEVEENGHIEGAVHIQLNELVQNLNDLPSFNTPIVVYCGSGWRATIAMTALHGLGWTDVRALKTAFADWLSAGNPVVAGLPEASMMSNEVEFAPEMLTAFDAMLQIYGVKPYGGISIDNLNLALGENPDLIVLDVRTAAEVEEKGYIDAPNWVHIALEDMIAQKAQWPAMDATIAIYCGSGHRSTMAMAILGTHGYENVTSMQSGYAAWLEAGYPTIGAPEPVAPAVDLDAGFVNMLATMEGYNTVQADALFAEMVEDTPPFILDVRTTEEVEASGHIEGAYHIPLAELAQHTNLLPDFDTPIVTYCGTGWRSTIAMTSLYGMGWNDVRALKTAFVDWVDQGYPVVAGVPEAMVLDAVTVNADLLAAFDTTLAIYGTKPYGVIDADGLNATLVEYPDLIVIDSRRADELGNGVIDIGEEATFIHIALEDILANKDLWPADKEARIVIYCGSGHRSTMALTIMGLNGYTNLSSLKGGFGGWVGAGFPVAEYAAP